MNARISSLLLTHTQLPETTPQYYLCYLIENVILLNDQINRLFQNVILYHAMSH